MDKVKLEARKKLKAEQKVAERIELEKNQKPVKSIDITIEWKKSRMWGSNPMLEARVSYRDGSFSSMTSTCSGCGYCKESTVVADVFNHYLKYKLWKLSAKKIKGGGGSGDKGSAPYGINEYCSGRGYSGGIGTNCYTAISEYIGGKFESVAHGKTFDAYKYTDKRK